MACKSCGGFKFTPNKVALPLPTDPSICPEPTCNCENYCEEDHTATTIYKKYGYTLKVKYPFSWPEVGSTVNLQVENVDSLVPGSILWNPSAGYLTVQSFDFGSQIVVAENEGESCNTYTGGESLPACSHFGVGFPSCVAGSDVDPNTPYLAADFTAPADGDCALASVTTIQGLTLEDIVSVNGFVYRLDDIINSNTIRLCNDGDGAPVGTVILWDEDDDGIPNIPILVTAEENPCTREGIIAGVLLACDGMDVTRPLVGSVDGQLPVWNNVTERFELKSLNTSFTLCTSLSADLTLDPAHVGSYIVSVVSTDGMFAGYGVIIDNVFFTINTVDDGVTLHITPAITPAAVVTYGQGFPLCVYSANATSASVTSPINVLTAVNENAAAPITLNIVNPSLVSQMHVMVSWELECNFTTSSPVLVGTSWEYELEKSENGGPDVSLLGPKQEDTFMIESRVYSRTITKITTHVISPGGSLSLEFNARIKTSAQFASSEVMTSLKQLSISV